MSASPVVNTQKTAYHVFAAEFDDTSPSYSKSDGERTPSYVITPIGVRLSRTFVAGVLAEVEYANDEMFRRHTMSPTGAFVTHTGQYQPEPVICLGAATPPAFILLTDKTRTYESDDTDVIYSSVRLESINTIGADVRDRRIVSAAEATLHRIVVLDEALSISYRGDNLVRALEARDIDSTLTADVPRATDHCGTTRTYLKTLREIIVQTLELVAGDRGQVNPFDVTPGGGENAVLDPLPESDFESAANVNIEVDEVDASKIEANAGEFENKSSSELAVTSDSESRFDDGAESEAVEPESGSEPIAEPDSKSESAFDPESVAAETTVAVESQPGTSESEPASESSTTVNSEPGLEPAAEPELEPVVESDLTSEPELEPVIDSLDTEPEPDFDGGTLSDFEDDISDTDATDTSPLDDSGNGTLGGFDDGFNNPDPEAGDPADSTGSALAGADDSVDPDRTYGLDGDERIEIESEFDTEFTSGADVDPAGEADIDVPDADDLTKQLKDESAAAVKSDPEPATVTAEPEPAVGSKPEPTLDATSGGDEDEADADPDTGESAKDINLGSVVVDAIDNLGDGDGVTRDEAIAAVIDEYDTDLGAIENAIQEALLSDRCYKPWDGVPKAI